MPPITETDTVEQLTTGHANVDTSGEYPVVKINPIGEGEVTTGQSGEKTVWTREALQEAVDKGRLGDPERMFSDLVKGEGGENPHFPMNESVPPENKLARVQSSEWDYEEGVGPVATAQLADDSVASQIELGLLDISADLSRSLGEYNEEYDAREVDEILAMPRMTIVDRGASANASIEPATAEALGYNPSGETHPDLTEQLASEGDAVRWESGSGGAREPANERFGVVVNPAPDDSDRDWMVAVYQANSDYDGWEARQETQPMADDTLERVGPDGVDSLPPVSQVFDAEQNADGANAEVQQVAEPAEPGRGAVGTTTPMPDDDTDKLREQLSESQSRVSELENTKGQLAEQNEDLEDELDDTESELEEVKDEKEDLEERVSDLEEDYQPIKEAIAGIAAGDSKATAEQMAERFTGEELIDMLADEEDDRSPSEQVREQLAAGVEPRGDAHSSEENQEGDYTEEQLAEADSLAREVMGGQDVMQAADEQLSAREYVKRHKGVDPITVNSADELRAKVNGDGGDA